MEVFISKRRKTGGRNFTSENQPENRGRKPWPVDIPKIENITNEHIQSLINLYMQKSRIELKFAMNNEHTPALELMVASIIWKAVAEGDERRFDFILNRTIGKVKEEIDIKAYIDNLDRLNDAQIIELGEGAIEYLKTSNG